MSKRLRIFAGPNGSGKSTLKEIVEGYVNLGVYVNADEIKKNLIRYRKLNFSDFRITGNQNEFLTALKTSTLAQRMQNIDDVISGIRFSDTILYLNDGCPVDDYFVSFLTAYIWDKLLGTSHKFTIETVMSHSSKLQFIQRAKKNGFKIYLYYVSLADPELNKRRVQTRVAQGGHNVAADKIVSRYNRSLDNLYAALKEADKAYIFDNSAGEPKMFAIKENETLEIQNDYIPQWFTACVLDKIDT